MKNKLLLFLIVFIIIPTIKAQEMSHELVNPLPFTDAEVRFEQNATDGDVEVVFEINGGDDGLMNLIVSSPDKRIIGEFGAPDLSTLGIRQFKFESPEPTDIDELKAAYPEGTYIFKATSTSGLEYYSESVLSHNLPPVVSFIYPAAESENIEVNNLILTWSSADDLAGYTIEIDQEDLGVNLLVALPGSVNKFSVPDGFLQPETEYILSIGTLSVEGNISVVETSFMTGKNE